ncbi:MAG TPA: prealbumin-like fold domain-containing protein, partial [Cellulomonas sp.]
PTGYVLPGTVFAVAIGATSTSVDLGTIENTAIDGTLSWQKVDTSGNALPGSQWALTAPDGTVTTVVDNGANDTDATVGSLSVAGLTWGDYTLTETVAPTGYARSSTVFTATIGATTTAVDLGEIQNIKYESQVLSAPDDDPTSTASTSTSDVSSASSSSLATTGADVPFWVVATAGGLLLSGLVLTLVAAVRRRRTAITPERRS